MKDKALTRGTAMRGVALDGYGRFAGPYAPGSVPANAISCTSLSVLGDSVLGTVYSGTLFCGEAQGQNTSNARLVIGQEAYGIQAFNENGTKFFSMSWKDQSFALGYEGSPQVRMRDGNVEIDGDCIVNGTLSANKILVGDSWVTTMIGGGLLAIGSGDGKTPDNPADPFSGFRVSHATASASGKSTVWQNRAKVAGFKAGEMTFWIDTATGEFVSQGSGAPDEVYTKVAEGYIDLSNVTNVGAGVTAQLRFISHTFDEDDVDTVETFGVKSSHGGLQIQSITDTTYAPHIELLNSDGSLAAGYYQNSLTLRGVMSGADVDFGVLDNANGDAYINLSYPTVSSLNLYGTLKTHYGVNCYGSLLRFEATTGGWPARPDAPTDQQMYFRPDPINHRMEFWNGQAWYSLDMTAV